MDPAAERLSSEQQFHDRQARQRADTFRCQPGRLVFPDDVYLDHETWIRPAFDALGDLAGTDVLDFGCGHGMAAVVLSRQRARVVGFDLSAGYLAEARLRAEANGVSVQYVQADGNRLPFATSSFDRIWGNAVLHHLDLPTAAPEIRRVLRPGGWAVFCEPWGENALLGWARRRLRYAGKERTPDEVPLRRHDVQVLGQHFSSVATRGYQLLSMARRVLRRGRLTAGLDWCDAMLLERVPRLQTYCRYLVLVLKP